MKDSPSPLTAFPAYSVPSSNLGVSCSREPRLSSCILGQQSNDWRDIPPSKQVLTPRIGLPEIRPIATDGILIYGVRADGLIVLSHLSNLIVKPVAGTSGPKSSKPKTPKRSRCNGLDELL